MLDFDLALTTQKFAFVFAMEVLILILIQRHAGVGALTLTARWPLCLGASFIIKSQHNIYKRLFLDPASSCFVFSCARFFASTSFQVVVSASKEVL